MKYILFGLFFLTATSVTWADLDDIDEFKDDKQKKKNSQEKKENAVDSKNPDLGSSSAKKDLTPSARPVPKKKLNDSSRKKPKSQSGKQPGKAGGKKSVEKDQHDSRAPIHWKAKGFKGTKDGKVVELKNNVVVTQGKMTMIADKAKIFFDDKKEVTKVVAKGNVKVTKKAILRKDRITARGNEATFYNTQNKVVLKGRASLLRGGDIVRGKQISYELDTGWITVDKVEGVVQPGEK